jgi:hypothetical protein
MPCGWLPKGSRVWVALSMMTIITKPLSSFRYWNLPENGPVLRDVADGGARWGLHLDFLQAAGEATMCAAKASGGAFRDQMDEP